MVKEKGFESSGGTPKLPENRSEEGVHLNQTSRTPWPPTSETTCLNPTRRGIASFSHI